MDASKVNLVATSLMTSRPAIPIIKSTRATKESSSEAMVGRFVERGLPMPALVDGYCYCGHGEGVEDEIMIPVC